MRGGAAALGLSGVARSVLDSLRADMVSMRAANSRANDGAPRSGLLVRLPKLARAAGQRSADNKSARRARLRRVILQRRRQRCVFRCTERQRFEKSTEIRRLVFVALEATVAPARRARQRTLAPSRASRRRSPCTSSTRAGVFFFLRRRRANPSPDVEGAGHPAEGAGLLIPSHCD